MLHKEIIDFYLPIIKKYRILFGIMGFSGFITGMSAVVLPVLLKLETDQLVQKNSDLFFSIHLTPFQVFVAILVFVGGIYIIEKILGDIANIFLESKKDLFLNEIQLNLYKMMQYMDVGTAMSVRFKYLTEVIRRSFPDISYKLISFPNVFINFGVKLIGLSAVYAYFDIRLLGVIFISTVVAYLINLMGTRISNKYNLSLDFSFKREFWKYSYYLLHRFSDLVISGGLYTTLERYEGVLKGTNSHTLDKEKNSLIFSIQEMLNTTVRDIVLKSIVGYGVFYGTSSVGMVVLVVSSMGTLAAIMKQIFNLNTEYHEFMFQQETVLLLINVINVNSRKDYNKSIDTIEFRELHFQYPNLVNYELEYIKIAQNHLLGKKIGNDWLAKELQSYIDEVNKQSKEENPNIFSDLNILFEKGKIYGVVGKNGAGKTTLMYLLSGFYKNYSGDILMNGVKSKDFSTKSFLNNISFLTQIPFFMDIQSTIRDNLTLGCKREVSDEELYTHLEKFGIAKKIQQHSKGLNAQIGNDIDLSGGEKQIISFIRLILQDRDVIIMDEGTNQLDVENEILVMNELLQFKQNKIIIFITHRMSTISKADIIYCLEKGKFSHKGTHEELLNSKNNIYSKFYKAQIQHF